MRNAPRHLAIAQPSLKQALTCHWTGEAFISRWTVTPEDPCCLPSDPLLQLSEVWLDHMPPSHAVSSLAASPLHAAKDASAANIGR